MVDGTGWLYYLLFPSHIAERRNYVPNSFLIIKVFESFEYIKNFYYFIGREDDFLIDEDAQTIIFFKQINTKFTNNKWQSCNDFWRGWW